MRGYSFERTPLWSAIFMLPLRLLDRTDRARTDYARHLYGADLSDPGLYDLIVATDKLSIEDAAQVVTAFLSVSGLQSLNDGLPGER